MSDLVVEQKCRGCYFNINKKCVLNRLEKFEKNGGTIVQDEDGENKIIGRYCSAYRKQSWANNKNINMLDTIVRLETLIQTEVHIYAETYMQKDMETTLNSLYRQTLKPSLVVVIFNGELKPNKLIKLLDSYNLPYRLDVIKQKGLGKNDCIDIAVSKCKSYFYQILNQGQTLHPNFLYNLDDAINDKLERLLFINGNENQGDTVSIDLHKKLGGNTSCLSNDFDDSDNNIVLNCLKEKVNYIASKNNYGYLIKNVDFIAE